MQAEHWGEYVRRKRLEKDFTLRGFCKLIGLDPSNWHKVEHGICGLPKDQYKLKQIINHLELTGLEAFEFWVLYASYEMKPTGSIFDKLPILIKQRDEKKLMKLFKMLQDL